MQEMTETLIHESSQPFADIKDIVITPKKAPIKWVTALFMAAIHLCALGALFTFSWKALILCLVLHWLTGGVGITLGYHRLFTHRSFKVPKWLEYVFSIIGSLACQSGTIAWVAAHRIHHAKSDAEGDPHSPLKGFFWAHMLWCVSKNDEIDDYKIYSKYCPDLANDPIHVFINNTHIMWTLILAAFLYAWGGWPFIFWGIFARLVLVYHCTWFVNSAAHVWGYRTYKTSDVSKNLWWVAFLTYGEGWHNNHHAFQYSARHGLKWWEIDTTYWMIKTLEFFGLAKAIKLPSQHVLAQAAY